MPNHAESEPTTSEIRHLKACINDLIGVAAMPAIWRGAEPRQVLASVLDVLPGMLRLELAYVRVRCDVGEAPIEMMRVGRSREPTMDARTLGEVLDDRLGPDPRTWPPVATHRIGDGELSIATLRLGLHGELGVLVAASARRDFPLPTERLLLSVATNQAAGGLQEARLLTAQKRVAEELDRRVAQRTAELAAANEELRREVAERRLVEERLRLEERELKRSEALLAEAQRLSSTGSFSWNVTTDEIRWSDQLHRIYELEPGAPLTHELIASRYHPDDRIPVTREMMRARDAGADVEDEFRLRLPDGSVKQVHFVAHAVRDADGGLEYIGAVQDVTERRRSEEALGRVRAELAHVARVTTLGALTASIAHEVNQPLAGIVTNASTCLRMLAADPPNVQGARETARRTIRDGHRASDVITRLRALFARTGGTTELVDLNEAAREVIALSASEMQRGRVALRAELAEDLPLASGDRVQLQQVVLNLLLNAADAMLGVDDRPRQVVVTTARDGDDRVRLAVRDVGVGFDAQEVERLFAPFHTTKPGGMGVGLSVSRSIIEHHRGRLWAEPNDGPGATFSFSIPWRPDGADERTNDVANDRASVDEGDGALATRRSTSAGRDAGTP